MKTTITALAILFTALSLSGCTDIKINKKDVVDDQPKSSTVKLGSVSKDVFTALETKGDRSIIGTIGKDGDLSFFGINGQKFKFPKESTKLAGKGKLKKTITIEFYQNSPECFLIRPGDGTKFWYPWDCPK